MWLLALASLGVGCTNDEPGGETPVATRGNEVQLVFNGANGENQEYTKAIASESENKIDKLDVYLFASDAADGTYYYLETWKEGTAYDPDHPENTNFVKQGAGTSWKASIYPNELKGLPYLKLLCVANHGSVGNITDSKFYNEAGTEEPTALTAVTVDADGTVTNAGAATTEETFRKIFTKQMKNDAGSTDIIHTPLLMTGEGKTKISGSVSKVDVTLKRVVARFDIDNTASKSQLTIEKITLAQARKSGSFWNTTLTAYEDADGRAASLMQYADVTFTDFVGANQGTTESALYVYPGLATDESYLLIQGKYKSPVPGSGAVEVTYKVPIMKTDPATQTSSYIAILANNRYQLHITDVTQSNIYATFEVEDWTSGGGIQIKPDNDAPLFDPEKNQKTRFTQIGGDAIPTAIDGLEASYRVADNSSFKVTVAATGKVYTNIEAALTKAADWLTLGAPEYEEVDGIQYTTFTATVSDESNKEPVSVHFINETSSYDPDLWTTLNFYGPSVAPTLEDGGNHSLGNTIDGTEKKANMYNVVGSYLTVKVWSADGSAMTLPDDGKLEQVGDPVIDGFYTSYKIRIKEKLADGATAEITFNNALDNTLETKLTVTALATAMTAELGDDATDLAKIEGTGSSYTVTTNGTALDGGQTFTLKINAPQDVIPNLPNGKWLKVVKAGFADGVSSYTVSYNASAANTDEFNITFVNKLDATETLTVAMKNGTLDTTP